MKILYFFDPEIGNFVFRQQQSKYGGYFWSYCSCNYMHICQADLSNMGPENILWGCAKWILVFF
jgi:hypothetical protein